MAGPVDLLFAQAPLTDNPVNLVFGEADLGAVAHPVTVLGVLPALTGVVMVVPALSAQIVGTLPALVGNIHVAMVVDVTISGAMPGLTGVIDAVYLSNTQRPTVGMATAPWQVADDLGIGAGSMSQKPLAAPAGFQGDWQEAQRLSSGVSVEQQEAVGTERLVTRAAHQESRRLGSGPIVIEQQDGLRDRRLARAARHQEAAPARAATAMRNQDGLRDRRNWAAAPWQLGAPHYVLHSEDSGPARWLNVGREADHQDAMRPPPGTSPGVTPVVVEPCYTPPDGDEVHLLFADPRTGDTDLVFVCEKHDPGTDPVAVVVVPIKRVYVVLNESSLRRVDSNVVLPTFAMSMSLDVDSWTWSFSASLPGEAFADLQPASPGEPILVELTLNGVVYRMQVERRSRDRTFAATGIKISGRGVAALLDTPYSPVMHHSNSTARTAQQIMGDVLTLNGVSIGWDIDYAAVDWSVPAGVFSHQGSYISALNAIAEAAGSYIQPHPTEQVLRVLPRYPELPWNWGNVTPDFEIPSAVSTVENIEWVDKAIYNRVFVSGVQEGVLGRVTRAGTDGGLVAPMVTNPLITTSAAARQRGIPVLSDTGSQAAVTLRMPVLEQTGIIVPGKFVRYVDGGTVRRGLARSVSVDIKSPDIWQTITLETHV